MSPVGAFTMSPPVGRTPRLDARPNSASGRLLLWQASRALAILAARAGDECLDRDQVVEHGPVCGDLVAPPNRVEDAPMVLVGPCGATGGVEGLLSALAQEVHQ